MNYLELIEQYNIPVVKAVNFNFSEAKAELKTNQMDEGFIVRFNDGHMLKLKTEWYLLLHKTMEHLSSEKDVIRIVLDNLIDDAKAFMPADLIKKVDDFGKKIFDSMTVMATAIAWDVLATYDNTNGSRKAFAEYVNAQVIGHQDIYFRAFTILSGDENIDTTKFHFMVYDLILEKVKKNLGSSTNVEKIRALIGGHKWEI